MYDYIDALIRRDPKRIAYYERKEFAVDHEYDYEAQEKIKEIVITPKRLLEILTCQDPLCFPSEAKLVIRKHSVPGWRDRPDKHVYICTAFFAEIAALPWLTDEMRESLKPFLRMQPDKVDGYHGHVYDEGAHTGLNISENPSLVNAVYVDEEVKVNEELVSEKETPQGIEKIYLCEAEPPYYTKRTYTPLKDLIRCETGWSIDGPWYGPEAYEEDTDDA
jgi:hypothetical protein